MVGPDFKSPSPPKVARFTQQPLTKHIAETPAVGKAGARQTFVFKESLRDDWWTLFHSKELNFLIHKGLANSPTLKAAYAALRQTQEIYNTQLGNTMFPSVDAVVSGQRQRALAPIGLTGGTNVYNLFNATLNVGYTLDLFGGLRRQLEALRSQIHYQEYLLIGAYLSLTSNIALTSITIASLEAQIRAKKELIHFQLDQLKTLRKQYELGAISNAIVFSQTSLVEQNRATLPILEKNLSRSEHALSVLVGESPDKHLPHIKLDNLVLPKHLPVTLPSELVRQRPDIRASEELLHAASAQIGVAKAQFFPQVVLTGYDGWQATVASTLFTPAQKVWNMAATVTQPVFHAGAIFSNWRAAVAAFEQAHEVYQDTVLKAFQNVADVLRAIETDAQALQAEMRAEIAAKKFLRLAKTQYDLGATSYLVLLEAQQQYQSVYLLRIVAQAARYSDTVALYQALGGAWWKRQWCATKVCKGV